MWSSQLTMKMSSFIWKKHVLCNVTDVTAAVAEAAITVAETTGMTMIMRTTKTTKTTLLLINSMEMLIKRLQRE